MSAPALPRWPDGTATVLVTGGAVPHAIPISTALAAGDGTVLFALSRRRASLVRLRRDPRCALVVLAGDDVAATLHGSAAVVREEMQANDRVAALRMVVARVQDHTLPRFRIDAGVAWHWTQDEAAAGDAAIRAELAELAGFKPGS